MSQSVTSGSVTAAQRHLNGVLRQVGRADSLPAVLYHCMRARPHHVAMINAATGEQFSNARVLAAAAAGARALVARRRRRACVLAANHEHLLAAQLACLLAGTVPLALDPEQTIFELGHFLKLWSPEVIFCDAACLASVQRAARSCCPRGDAPEVVTLDRDGYRQFAAGHSDSIDDFQVAAPTEDGVVLVLPTSGSTGSPRVALLTHRGMVAQLPSLWAHASEYPSLAGLTSTTQWLTWWCVVSTSAVYGLTLVMTPRITPQVTLEMYRNYKVEWGFMSPALASRLLGVASRESLASVRTLLVGGAAIAVSTVAALQEVCQPGSYVRQSYGMTELTGFAFLPDESTPLESVGRPLNIFQCKIVDENGQELGPNQKGELYMKSDVCLFKGYYGQEAATRESFTADGWLVTGVLFYRDERDNYYFVERRKFSFKVDNFQVGPEEVESLVCGVRGVQLACVCGVPAGAAALVVRRADTPVPVTREEIHHAVSQLNEYKRLRGGIAFVDSLPLTPSGKLRRAECASMLQRLVQENKCFV